MHWTDATTRLPETTILPEQIALAPGGTLVMSYVCPADQESATRARCCP